MPAQRKYTIMQSVAKALIFSSIQQWTMPMDLQIKKLYDDTIIPRYEHPGDAGLDVFSHEDHTLVPGERHVFGLGFAAQFPEGYVALVWDRGSMAIRAGIRNLAGVIDSGFRGEWKIVLLNVSEQPIQIKKGDKVAQILIQPIEQASLKVVDELDPSARGEKWCGSSGQ